MSQIKSKNVQFYLFILSEELLCEVGRHCGGRIKSWGSDDLGLQQDGVGVRPRPEDPVVVVKMIGEGLGDLVGAAAALVLVHVPFRAGGKPLVSGRRAPLLQVTQVGLPGPGAVVLLDLHGNQWRRKTRILETSFYWIYFLTKADLVSFKLSYCHQMLAQCLWNWWSCFCLKLR